MKIKGISFLLSLVFCAQIAQSIDYSGPSSFGGNAYGGGSYSGGGNAYSGTMGGDLQARKAQIQKELNDLEAQNMTWVNDFNRKKADLLNSLHALDTQIITGGQAGFHAGYGSQTSQGGASYA